ncbi:MAG: cytochrome c3 family protein [Nitrospirae bacterium]|nr:cytochrome c3 family protein [Nitrospirota bacterium]
MKKFLILVIAIIFCFFLSLSIFAGKNPGVVTLDTLSDKYESVRFNHESHTSMAGNCGTCHHEHGNSAALPCKDCHSITPAAFKNSVVNNFVACKNCHAVSDPDNPVMPGLKVAYHKTCFQCHRGMGNVGVDPKGCAEMCHAKKEQRVSMKVKK